MSQIELVLSDEEDRKILLEAARERVAKARDGQVVVLLDGRRNGAGECLITIGGIADTAAAHEVIYDRLVDSEDVLALMEKDGLVLCLDQFGERYDLTFTYSSNRSRERALTAIRAGVKAALGDLTTHEHNLLYPDTDFEPVLDKRNPSDNYVRKCRTFQREEEAQAEREAAEALLVDSDGVYPLPENDDTEEMEVVTV